MNQNIMVEMSHLSMTQETVTNVTEEFLEKHPKFNPSLTALYYTDLCVCVLSLDRLPTA